MSPDVHTLTGAYALDALDADERAAFEAHLAECPDCAHEVAELRATAARLGDAVSQNPPEHLRRRVLAEIARTRQQAPGGLRAVGSEHTARRNRWTTWVSLAAAAVAIMVAGAFAGVAINANQQLHDAQGQLGQTRQQLSQAQAHYAPVAALLAAPDVKAVTGTANGATATLLTSRSLGRSVLVANHMPVQPATRTYQVWGIGPAGFHSLGLLGNRGASTLSVADLGGARSIGITVEPAGGSPQPTTAPIMHFTIPT